MLDVLAGDPGGHALTSEAHKHATVDGLTPLRTANSALGDVVMGTKLPRGRHVCSQQVRP